MPNSKHDVRKNPLRGSRLDGQYIILFRVWSSQ